MYTTEQELKSIILLKLGLIATFPCVIAGLSLSLHSEQTTLTDHNHFEKPVVLSTSIRSNYSPLSISISPPTKGWSTTIRFLLCHDTFIFPLSAFKVSQGMH